MKKEDYKKRLKDLSKRKDLIPGVHNYCDRWCERCSFTKRCGSYALTEGFENDENRDVANEKFWDDLKVIFEVTTEMIMEKAEEFGLDLSNLDTTDYKHELVENDATQLSEDYGMQVLKWVKENRNEINERAKILLMFNDKDVLKLNDAVEVILWYSFFISAKIHRAFMDFGIDKDNDDNENYINDNLGSAKIALIAIDRSIAAQGYLLEKMPQFEDELLEFLADLSKIKKDVLAAFPYAMEFKRPGFDD